MFESIDGIPLHPLFVHAPIILIPVSVVAALLWVMKPAWRGVFDWWLLALVGGTLVTTLLAGSSGEELARTVRETHLVEEHEELAEGLEAFVWVFSIAAFGAITVARLGARLGNLRRAAAMLCAAAVVIGGVGAVAMDVLAGHAGAKAAWDEWSPDTVGSGGTGDEGHEED